MGAPRLLLLKRLTLKETIHRQLLVNISNLSRNHLDPCSDSWAIRNLSYCSQNFTQFRVNPSHARFCKAINQMPTNRFLNGVEGTSFYSMHTNTDQVVEPRNYNGTRDVRGGNNGGTKVKRKKWKGRQASQQLRNKNKVVKSKNDGTGDVRVDDNGTTKVKRKKLKGRREVAKFLKQLRWKKKKEFERMTAEEKTLFKLTKAQKKEERLVGALKKIEPKETSETKHDPEILTPEDHFYLLKTGLFCKNYVPVGTRGVYQGVILNMHLHWKKHETLKVIVKTFTPEEVREMAVELARLSGGIVLGIQEEFTIIMYRGKNYSQPPTEIMLPRVSLNRKKALLQSKYKEALRAVRKFILRLKDDLENLHVKEKPEDYVELPTKAEAPDVNVNETVSIRLPQRFDEYDETKINKYKFRVDDSLSYDTLSESEDLSDIFETDSDGEMAEKEEKPLYLDTLEKVSVRDHSEGDDFLKHLRQISDASKRGDSLEKTDVKMEDLDEIDKIFLRADSLLNKRRK